jgi:very-short-patch-repair endonuclease
MAAALWGLRAWAHLEVTVPGRRTGPEGVIVHRTRLLADCDVGSIRAIPVTALARTVVDLAELLGPDALSRVIDKAGRLDAFDLHDLRATAARMTGRRGARVLSAALGLPSAGMTRSELEDAFLALCRRAHLPSPRTNVHVAAADRLYEADALFGPQQLIVELDGRLHDNPVAFQADRRRDAGLAAAGFQTVRYTARRLRDDQEAVVAELRAILSRRSG